MKKKILLAEQWGSCDAHGKSIGHTSKVLNEYVDLLKDSFEINVIAHPNLLETADEGCFCSIKHLEYSICEEEKKTFVIRIKDKIKLFKNIHRIWKQKGYDIIWFFRGDFFLLMYALFHRKVSGTKYYCLMYHNQYGDGIIAKIVDFIYRHGIRRFDGMIYTQKKMNVPHKNTFYMPDYLYRPDKYCEFISKGKIDKVVCVGTMNRDKDLEGLVQAFNGNGYPLEIVGRFLEREHFEYLKSIAKENIQIQNVILSKDEYNRKLGEAKYSVIPYKMSAYSGRTSGVLQESMFLQAIPIAPKQLLEDNNVPGIGYSNLEELEKKGWISSGVDCKQTEDTLINKILQEQRSVLQKYDWLNVCSQLVAFLIK